MGYLPSFLRLDSSRDECVRAAVPSALLSPQHRRLEREVGRRQVQAIQIDYKDDIDGLVASGKTPWDKGSADSVLASLLAGEERSLLPESGRALVAGCGRV